jgi:hypothetical protein
VRAPEILVHDTASNGVAHEPRARWWGQGGAARLGKGGAKRQGLWDGGGVRVHRHSASAKAATRPRRSRCSGVVGPRSRRAAAKERAETMWLLQKKEGMGGPRHAKGGLIDVAAGGRRVMDGGDLPASSREMGREAVVSRGRRVKAVPCSAATTVKAFRRRRGEELRRCSSLPSSPLPSSLSPLLPLGGGGGAEGNPNRALGLRRPPIGGSYRGALGFGRHGRREFGRRGLARTRGVRGYYRAAAREGLRFRGRAGGRASRVGDVGLLRRDRWAALSRAEVGQRGWEDVRKWGVGEAFLEEDGKADKSFPLVSGSGEGK